MWQPISSVDGMQMFKSTLGIDIEAFIVVLTWRRTWIPFQLTWLAELYSI